MTSFSITAIGGPREAIAGTGQGSTKVRGVLCGETMFPDICSRFQRITVKSTRENAALIMGSGKNRAVAMKDKVAVAAENINFYLILRNDNGALNQSPGFF